MSKYEILENDELHCFLEGMKKKIYRITQALESRGIINEDNEIDDYEQLINDRNCLISISYSLYEEYFQPRRHEFELQAVIDFVESFIKSRGFLFASTAAASGILGGIAFELLKKIGKVFAVSFLSIKRTNKSFNKLIDDVNRISKYLKGKKQTTVDEIKNATDIDGQKISTIFKLVGYKCIRRKGISNIWVQNIDS